LDNGGQPLVQHPAHDQDVVDALLYLLSEDCSCPTTSFTIIGHSCGAFLACSAAANPSIKPYVKALICLDGIYNLSYLKEEYPDYSSFLEQAFGKDELRWPKLDHKALDGIPILVAHSREDELLSLKQPREFYAMLGERKVDTVFNADTLKGKHDELLDQEEVLFLVLEAF